MPVYRTDSGIRPLLSFTPAHTTRRLSGASKRSEFSVNVFLVYTNDIKPQTKPFVNSFHSEFSAFGKVYENDYIKRKFFDRKTFDFWEKTC